MAGYTRADGSNNIADGNVVNASDLDAEYDAIQAAFNSSTGHTHDGTSAEGAPIEKVGPVQDLVVTATEVKPKTDNTLDLGTATLEFKDAFFDGTVKTDTLTVDENATVTGNLTVNGNTTLGNAATDTVTITADVASNVIPSADNTYDLGASGSEWKDLYIDGTANIDSLVADTADINAGTIDNTIIGGGTAAAGTFTTATATTGNITNVNATTVDTTNIEVTNVKAKDGTASATIADSTGVMTIASSVLTTTDINGGTIDGVTIGGASAGAGTFTQANFGDNAKAIFGAGSDLQIYHDPSTGHSIINEVGSGSLQLRGTNIQLKNADNTKNYIAMTDGGDVDLYYDNALKLSTTATGIDVTGTVTADGLTVSTAGNLTALLDSTAGTPKLQFRSGSGSLSSYIQHGTGGTAKLSFQTNGTTERMVIADNGDISFYEDTGTSARIFYDASTQFVVNEDSADFDFRVESDTNTHALFVQGSDGHVGIGTSSPTQTLQVSDASGSATVLAQSTVSGATGNLFMRHVYGNATYLGMTSSTGDYGLFYSFAGTALGIGTNNAVPLILGTNSTERTRIDSVGTLIHKAAAIFNEDGGDADFRVESDTNTHMLFVDAGNNRIGINSAGPNNNLEVQAGSAGGVTFPLSVRNSSASFNGRGTGIEFRGSSTNVDASMYNYIDGTLKTFYYQADGHRFRAITGPNEEMLRLGGAGSSAVFNEGSADIDFRVESDTNTHALFVEGSSGRVGINMTPGATVQLDVTSSLPYVFRATTSTVLSYANVIQANLIADVAGQNCVFTSSYRTSSTDWSHLSGNADQDGSPVNTYKIYGNGNIVNVNNSYGALSDLKLKENIVDSGSQWDDLKAVQVRKYSMKSDNLDAPNQLGVIAQELESSGMAGLVYETTDRDENGNDLGTTTKHVHYSVLYMKSVKALQEAMTRIETLEARIAAFENA